MFQRWSRYASQHNKEVAPASRRTRADQPSFHGYPGPLLPQSRLLPYPPPSAAENKIAFTYGLDDVTEIYVVNADGMDESTGERDHSQIPPRLVADGSKIAFRTSDGADTASIYIMNADGFQSREISVYNRDQCL
ncbi:MAG: hypothetical protein IPO22_22275 [Anaerolineales bacterium]|nr:hypothetical protein [Anaerolineales bacterium]